MLGAILGDLVGTPYEPQNMRGDCFKSMEFPLLQEGSRPSDDSVLTCAVADAILQGKPFVSTLQDWARRYSEVSYGAGFRRWIEDPQPYQSPNNGSAMRVSSIGWLFPLDEALSVAAKSAAISHDHPDGIQGAQAVVLAISMARFDRDPELIRIMIERFAPHYNLRRTAAEIRPNYGFDVSCRGSVGEAISCALEASSVEEAVRLAVSLGGDADTQACIAGAIAEARFGIPPELEDQVMDRLPKDMQEVVLAFKRHLAG